MSLLEVRHLAKSFGAVKVADDLSFMLEKGAALGVIGPNGAGKSSMFHLIGGSLKPGAGQILLDGADITALRPEQRCRAGIARTFQVPQPFSKMTVFENLLVPSAFGAGAAEPDGDRYCVQVLEQTGLLRKANQPAGTLTLLERKRLELARALAARPRLLLLDEIAGGLTEHETAQLVETIKEINRSGTAIIWIEHIVHALTAVVQRLMVINFGAKVADGSPGEVMGSTIVKRIYMGIEVA
ncbi:MAG: ATP-binding cassette domain-containing protein [Proteobacteria bacterium]|nr:ATP-binding cassette domain-containing protein [Pseudomonadota bacterium]